MRNILLMSFVIAIAVSPVVMARSDVAVAALPCPAINANCWYNYAQARADWAIEYAQDTAYWAGDEAQYQANCAIDSIQGQPCGPYGALLGAVRANSLA